MKVDVKDTATPKLREMAKRVGDLGTLMERMGKHMMPSIRKNFDVAGRPNQWAELKTVEVLAKGKSRSMKKRVQGRARMGGPLVLSGDLRSSIGYTPTPKDLILWAKPEPGVKGPVHQWGVPDSAHGGSGKLAGRGNTVAIPARPFLVFQAEDLDWFRKSASAWIRVGGGA